MKNRKIRVMVARVGGRGGLKTFGMKVRKIFQHVCFGYYLVILLQTCESGCVRETLCS